mmetsp:Transcript_63203/g.102400  ORF Transcript_63203/g.102400 Transcript_63203/m.102400 type:complete len:493 (-) Transcript_63203:118-1596(-)
MSQIRLPTLQRSLSSRKEIASSDGEKTKSERQLTSQWPERVSTPNPLDNTSADTPLASLRRVQMAPSLDPSQSPFLKPHSPPTADQRTSLPPLPLRRISSPTEASRATPASTRKAKTCQHGKSTMEGLFVADLATSPDSAKVQVIKCRRSKSTSCIGSPSQHGNRRRTFSPTSQWSVTPSTTSSTPLQEERTPAKTLNIRTWRLGSKIGQGAYGTVHKALEVSTGMIFAVKQAHILLSEEGDRRYVEKLSSELDIFKNLRHPNIVSYLGHEFTDGVLSIFMEYLSCGSLKNILDDFGPLKGQLLTSTALGMIQGLDHLHTRSPPVIHRDIKCANVLVDAQFCIKLADFGCSKKCDVSTTFTTIGSIPWMAPEVIHQKHGYGRKADIWSLGCTIIELATAEMPWGKGAFDNPMFALSRIGMSEDTPAVPDSMPAALQDLTHTCVQRSEADRPSSSQLMRHEVFQSTPLLERSSRSGKRLRQALLSPESQPPSR